MLGPPPSGHTRGLRAASAAAGHLPSPHSELNQYEQKWEEGFKVFLDLSLHVWRDRTLLLRQPALEAFLLLKANLSLVSSAPVAPNPLSELPRKKSWHIVQHKTFRYILWSWFQFLLKSVCFQGLQRHACYTVFFTKQGVICFYAEGHVQILVLLPSDVI